MKIKQELKTFVIYICIALLTFFIVILTSYVIKEYKQNYRPNIQFIQTNTVEINETINITDFVKELETSSKVLNTSVNTTSLGIQTIDFSVINKYGYTLTYSLQIEVIDTTPPVITAQDCFSTYVGTNIDLLSFASATDNSLETIAVKIIGQYNINQIGTYKLEYLAIDSSGNKATLPFTLNVTSKPVQNVSKPNIQPTYIDGVLIVNKTYALPSTYNPGLNKTALAKFLEMIAVSATENLELFILSGFRSYTEQQYTYNYWVSKDGQAKADTYSARPGHSEHQTGLAMDVNTLDNNFGNTPEGIWLANNCYKFGFILRYPKNKEHITGYKYEPWHIRYVGTQLATKLYNNGDWITLEEHFNITSKYN